ncbi:hypothetical protein [Photorhabdus sp. CRCIA-P01]
MQRLAEERAAQSVLAT